MALAILPTISDAHALVSRADGWRLFGFANGGELWSRRDKATGHLFLAVIVFPDVPDGPEGYAVVVQECAP